MINFKKIKENTGIHEIILLAIILVYIVLQVNSLSTFKQLPSPLFGGDYYYQLGAIYHVSDGGNILDSSSIKGTVPGYLPLYSIIVAPFTLLGMTPIQAIFFVSVLLMIAAMIVSFILFSHIFNDKYIGIIGAMLTLPIINFPIIKYTNFTILIMIPLLVLFLYRFYMEKNWKNAIILGSIIGLLAISHSIAFIGAIIIFSIFFLMEIIDVLKKKEYRQIHIRLKEYIYTYVIAGIVSLLYWFRPIFNYRLKIVDNVAYWGSMDFSRFIVKFIFLRDTITTYILNFSNIYNAIISVAIIATIIILFFIKGVDKRLRFIMIFTGGALIAIFSYFITEPIINMNFSPVYMNVFYMPIITVLIVCMGLKILFNYMSHGRENHSSKIYIIVSIAIIALLLLYNVPQHYNKFKNDRWMQVGTTPIASQYLEMQKFVLKNTKVNDVFLSTNELSFALNSLTGRKLMVNRRAQQNNPFLNFDERQADAAVILYGNSSAKRMELLKKYDVKYLYYDNYWINSEYSMQQGNTYPFDPLITRDSLEMRQYLDMYGVKYTPMNTWIDPAIKGEYIPKADVLYIISDNYRSFEKPWNADLDNRTKQVWHNNNEQGVTSVIYEIIY